MKLNYYKMLCDYLSVKDISINQFISDFNISHAEIISLKMNPEHINNLELLIKLSKFMNVSLDWLIFGEESPEFTDYQKGYFNGMNKGFYEGFSYCKKQKLNYADKTELPPGFSIYDIS